MENDFVVNLNDLQINCNKNFVRTNFPEFCQSINPSANQISIEINEEIINDKIVDIFSIILKKEYLADHSCFIDWIDNLLTIENRITEYHIEFLSNFFYIISI